MKHIKKIIFLGQCISYFAYSEYVTPEKNVHSSSDQKTNSLPFSLELSLDVIGLELDHYQRELKNDWSTNIHAEVIIEEAEILVQTAKTEVQPILKKKIVDLFLKHGLSIRFNSDNKIVVRIKSSANTTDTVHTDDSSDSDIEKEIEKKKRIKIPKHHKQKEAKQIFAPKKIHGARRTMNRLKKEATERARKAREEIKARIETKKNAVLKAQKKDLINQEARMREHVMLEHAKLKEEMLEQFRKNLALKDQNEKLFNEEHF